jgi:hypothetical protein
MVALAARTLPLWRSPLPFRADGLFYAAYAKATVESGQLPLATMATDDLGFMSLVTEVSLVTGVDPWLVAQPTSSLIATVPVILVVALARRIALGRGWSVGRARLAGLFAGGFLAVEGLYLHRAMVTDEQTAGLLLVPLALVALHRAVRTDRPAWWLAGLALLAVLPPLHNLEGMVTALTLTLLVALVAVRRRLDRPLGKLAAVTVAFWLAFGGYHLLAERYTPLVIIQEARFTDVPGLVVAWFVGGLLVVAWASRAQARTHRVAGWGAFGVMFGLIAINAWRAVFPGMPRTPPVVLWLLLPLALPAALAAWRGPDLWNPPSDGEALVANGAAALALIGVSLTAALTPVYLGTTYRTSLFLHVPAAVPIGMGVAALMARRPFERRTALRVGVAGLVLLSAAVSIPLAFGGLAPFNYRAVTTPGELASAEFAASHVEGQWAADDHQRRVAAARNPAANVTPAPTYEWLVDGRPPPECPTLVLRSWTTRGTQFPTTTPVRLSEEAYDDFRTRSAVVYDGGGRDRIQLVVPRLGSPRC